MSKKRKQYSSNVKSKVALAAIKGDQTTAEIAARFEIHPTMVTTWKRELLERVSELFQTRGAKPEKDHQFEVDNLYRQIDPLTVERDFLARKLDH